MRQCPNSFYLPLNDFFLTTSFSTRNVSANQEVQPGLRSTISSPSTCPNDQAPSARATHLCLAFWSLAPRWAVKAGCLYEVFCVNPCVAAQKTSPCQLRCIHFAQVVCRKSIKLSHKVPWTGEVVRDFPRLLQWKTCFKDLVMNPGGYDNREVIRTTPRNKDGYVMLAGKGMSRLTSLLLAVRLGADYVEAPPDGICKDKLDADLDAWKQLLVINIILNFSRISTCNLTYGKHFAWAFAAPGQVFRVAHKLSNINMFLNHKRVLGWCFWAAKLWPFKSFFTNTIITITTHPRYSGILRVFLLNQTDYV